MRLDNTILSLYTYTVSCLNHLCLGKRTMLGYIGVVIGLLAFVLTKHCIGGKLFVRGGVVCGAATKPLGKKQLSGFCHGIFMTPSNMSLSRQVSV